MAAQCSDKTAIFKFCTAIVPRPRCQWDRHPIGHRSEFASANRSLKKLKEHSLVVRDGEPKYGILGMP